MRATGRRSGDLVSAAEAAALLGVRTATVYAYASRGLLGGGARGPGQKARYPRELVERLRLRAASRAGHAPVAAAALRWGAPVLDSAITRLGPRGPEYRGERAIDLVEEPYEAVVERLWGCAVDWSRRLPRVATVSPRPSLHALVEIVAAHAEALASRPPGDAAALIRRLACAVGPFEKAAEKERRIAATAGASLRGAKLAPEDERLINAALVLLADHELNPSTFAARVAASAGAPWVDCVLAALGAAAGVNHASACQRAEAVWRSTLKSRRFAAPSAGFEAGAYPDGDPRGRALLELLRPRMDGGSRRLLDRYLAWVDATTGQLPSVDFALAVMSCSLELPPGASTQLFVLARTAGWLAHATEQASGGQSIRPRARYVGPLRSPSPR